MDNLEEEWRDIPDWEGFYRVSSLGRVKSLARAVQRKSHLMSLREKILKPTLGMGVAGQRYWTVALHRDGKKITSSIHNLVLKTFVGPRPRGFDGCHNDGDYLNNRLDNLRWDTRRNNMQDAIEQGTTTRGERSGSAKLTEAQVLEIRSLAGVIFQKDLSREFGVAQQTISEIVTRKIWGHI